MTYKEKKELFSEVKPYWREALEEADTMVDFFEILINKIYKDTNRTKEGDDIG